MIKWLLFLQLALILRPTATHAVMMDNFGHGQCGLASSGFVACGGPNTALTDTYPITVGTGPNRALVVFVAWTCSGITADVSGVTYNGAGLQRVNASPYLSSNNDTYLSIWSLAAGTQPASGSNNVVVTVDQTTCVNPGLSYSLGSAAISATHVDQSTTFSASNFNSNTGAGGTSGTVTLAASGTADLVANFSCQGTLVGSSSKNAVYINIGNGSDACGSDAAGTAIGGTTSITWKYPTSDHWGIAAAAFKDDGLSYAAQVVQSQNSTSTANAHTLATTITATGSNNLIVVAIGNSGTRTVSSVTDGTNSFVQATNAASVTGSNETDIWYLPKSTAGKTSITVTYSGANGTFQKMVWVYEVAGFHGVKFDSAANVSNGVQAAGAATGASVTTTASLDFIVGVDLTSTAVTANPQAGTPFAVGGLINSTTDAAAAYFSQSVGTYQPVWTDNGTNFSSSTAAFKETPRHRNSAQ